jgi:hypothetical protein
MNEKGKVVAERSDVKLFQDLALLSDISQQVNYSNVKLQGQQKLISPILGLQKRF